MTRGCLGSPGHAVLTQVGVSLSKMLHSELLWREPQSQGRPQVPGQEGVSRSARTFQEQNERASGLCSSTSPGSEVLLLPLVHQQMLTDTGHKLNQCGRYKKTIRWTSQLLTTVSLSARHIYVPNCPIIKAPNAFSRKMPLSKIISPGVRGCFHIRLPASS